MASTTQPIQIPYTFVVDTATTQPGSGSPFQYLAPPSYDGSSVAFLGSNQTYEGIYVWTGGTLATVSDNHTTIAELKGPPTSAQYDQPDAYMPNTSGQLAPCGVNLSRPRPALVAGNVAFFAANWPAGRCGIFAYDIATGQLGSPYLASNSDGYLTGGQFGQPTAGLSAAVFTASGPAGGPAPGLYSVPITGGGGTPAQLLDITTATTPSGKQIENIGNAQVRPLLPASELIVYGQHADGNEAIFSVQGGSLKTLVPEGTSIGSYTIASGAGIFWTELAYSGPLLAFNCQLTDGGGGILAGLIAMPQTSAPGDLVLIANAMQTIPGGGGMFDGNEFATPPVCDGTRVAFTGMYDATGGFGETFGLFVWNATTGLSAKVLDSNTTIGSRQIANMYLHDGSFVDGWLAASILFADQSYGIYLFDLSGF